MRACFEGGSLGQGLPSVTPQLEERSAQCAEQQHFSSLREIATLFRFKHISLVIINKNNNYSAFFLIFRKEYFSFFLPSFCLSFFLSLNESPPPPIPLSVCLSAYDMAYVVFVLKSMYSLPSCATQPHRPFIWVQRPPFLTQMNVFLWKSRNGCHFSWHGGETNKTPCSFKEAGAGTSHWTQTLQSQEHKIASKAKQSPFHAESLAWLVLSCTQRSTKWRGAE